MSPRLFLGSCQACRSAAQHGYERTTRGGSKSRRSEQHISFDDIVLQERERHRRRETTDRPASLKQTVNPCDAEDPRTAPRVVCLIHPRCSTATPDRNPPPIVPSAWSSLTVTAFGRTSIGPFSARGGGYEEVPLCKSDGHKVLSCDCGFCDQERSWGYWRYASARTVRLKIGNRLYLGVRYLRDWVTLFVSEQSRIDGVGLGTTCGQVDAWAVGSPMQ